MGKLKLPRLLSDGMILQQKKKVRIWGEDEPGRKVTVSLLGADYTTEADADGAWQVFLDEMQAGGAYQMKIWDDAGEERTVDDILIGDVFLCSGQSNMELPIARVMDQYPEEIKTCANPKIRTFKIIERPEFHGPLKDTESGEWKEVTRENFAEFSATAYFFAKHMVRMTGVPVGLINASLGGSRIESWMGRDMLEGYDGLLSLADRYQDEGFVRKRLQQNERQAQEWHSRLDAADLGVREDWAQARMNVSDWAEVDLPFFFQDTELKDFIGSVWFYREFMVGKQLAKQEVRLWLGTVRDSDEVYVNGVFVGGTGYQYPPRKYIVPEGVLKEGVNRIVIRVKSETGQGRFTDDKPYVIFRGEERVDLSGKWRYRIGAACEKIGETDFVSWKPTGLYHGMTAPCHKYALAGILWYQGESNTHEMTDCYLDLMERMICGYREKWGEELPFIYVQLPNFRTERYEDGGDETFSDWPAIREAQRGALHIPRTAMVTAIDLGEDNDLHPLNKESIGFRLAMQAAKLLYGKQTQCDGPQIENMAMERGQQTAWKVTLNFRDASGLYAVPKQTGRAVTPYCAPVGSESAAITDFELVDEKGTLHVAQAEIENDSVVLTVGDEISAIREIRYCYRNTNRGALLYNREGFPMTPFRIETADANCSCG